MSSATLALVLPMILRALGTSRLAIQDVCCSALVVLEHQLSLGAEFPESMVGELFESLGMALLALPGQRDQTQGALCAVSRHVVSTEDLQLARLAEMFFSDEEVVRQAVVVALADTQKNSLVEEGSLDPVAVHAVLRLGALDEKSQEKWPRRPWRRCAWSRTPSW
ncbi:unnamed protein product [Prorocentrum cordatum]|uniref:HEAT repeat-containing protein 1 n=1 Tax=Prorocentrum cordatum TaxID=2364126 RepID=A0ABN9RYE1_9DINO|nr:unnamed protein product [Polarella glacialis]